MGYTMANMIANLKIILIAFTVIVAALSTNIAFSNIDSAVVIPLQEKSAQTYYVEAHFTEGEKNEFMVDTGSGYTTIDENTLGNLQQSGKASYVKDIVGILADGSEKQVAIYHVSSLVLAETCIVENIEVAVFPGSTRHILGLNTLRQIGTFEFSFIPPQLVFRDCDRA